MNERDNDFGGMGRLDGGADDFDSLIAEYKAAEPKTDSERTEPQTGGAPDPATFREAGKRLGLSEEHINELLPANLKTIEEVEAARQSLLAEVQYEDAVNQQFVEYIKEDMARIQQARDMSDLMDLRRDLGERNASFAAKSEAEQTQLLLGKARTDPRIMDAWQNRYSNPHAWRNAKDALSAWTNTVSPHFDTEATAARMAVAVAVRGRSGHKPAPQEAPSYGQMDEAAFASELRELGLGD